MAGAYDIANAPAMWHDVSVDRGPLAAQATHQRLVPLPPSAIGSYAKSLVHSPSHEGPLYYASVVLRDGRVIYSAASMTASEVFLARIGYL